MKQLTFIIGGQELTRTDTLEIVSDAIGQFEAVFTFDNWWDGYIPTAQFTKDGKTIDVILNNNKCIVPPEALQGGGVFYVNVFSTDGTGDRKTANEVAVPLKTSGYKKDGSHSQDPTPTVYEQLLNSNEELSTEIKEFKETVNEQLKNVKVPIDSALDENSTNAIQNAVVTKEVKDLKNQLHGVRLTYSHNIDNLNVPRVRQTCSTNNDTGEKTYYIFFTYSCSLASIQEDAETKEITLVPKLTNIPPIEIIVDKNGNKEYHTNCDFNEEFLVLDSSKIDPISTKKEIVSLKDMEELVTQLGGTVERMVQRDSTIISSWNIKYEYRITFKNEETWNTFYDEFMLLALKCTTAFISEYTYLSEPIELTAEVIENA